ncbi:MAG: hypothetical protein KFW09_05745 [Oscillospiraceae bacterium]|nr:hypothetical protein [Oscillospiraceae bacterium]
MKIEKYNNCTVAENDKICIIQSDFNFYKINNDQKKKYVEGDLLSLIEIKDNSIYCIISIFIIILCFIIYFIFCDYKIIDINYKISIILLLLNIPIHELGHILALKFFYRESKFKIGLKFFFIFPAFYVDTSFSYFLPKYKKISVYLAGTLFNSIFMLISFIIFPDILKYYNILISNMFINFLPIIKSDGYYAIITLFEKYTKYKGKKKEYIEDLIRGVFMWLFISIISYYL